MSVRTAIHGSEDTLFIMFTCFKWLPLIELTNGYDFVYKWFDYLKMKGHLVTGYVIMPNHIHVLTYFSKTDKTINKIIGDGKQLKPTTPPRPRPTHKAMSESRRGKEEIP